MVGIAGVSEQGGRGALAQFLADQLTLTHPDRADYAHTLLVTPHPLPDFHTFLQPGVDLAKKLTRAATAASQLLVCKHH